MALLYIALFLLINVNLPSADLKKVGSFIEHDVDERVLKASEYAVNYLSQKEDVGLPCPSAWILQKANKQAVAGTNYKLTYHLKPHKCLKGALKHSAKLIIRQVCEVTVWEQLWNRVNSLSVTGYKCKSLPHHESNKKIDIGEVELFKQFIVKHNKTYGNRNEYLKRLSIFRENMKKVTRLQETEQGTAIYGATQFADLSEEEFKRYYLGLKPHLKQSNRRVGLAATPKLDVPDSFDWRTYNVVTPVKNQGMCGSCWAFSVTGNVEGQYAIKHKQLLSLSEQELVDCDKLDQGCEGGYMTNAYEQIITLGGLETESDYPYEGVDEKCNLTPSKVEVTLSSYVNISQDETEMAKWLVANGPISIGINANVMQFYFGGVSHPWKFLCNPESIDHGVLIVGYGVSTYSLFHKTLPYWIVKNSWGSSWGEQGYYRVYRGDGTCGVNLMASSALVN